MLILELVIITLIIIYIAIYKTKTMENRNATKALYYAFLFLVCISYGYLEYEILSQNPLGTTGSKVIFGHFSIYHGLMSILFLSISMVSSVFQNTFNGWTNLPWMILLEDMSYRLAAKEMPTDDSWVTWGIGGIDLWIIYIPFTYLILIFLTVIFKAIGRELGR